MVKFYKLTYFKPVIQLGKWIVKAILKLASFGTR